MWRVAALALLCCVVGFCAGCAQSRPGESWMPDTSIVSQPADNWFGPVGETPAAPASPNNSVRK